MKRILLSVVVVIVLALPNCLRAGEEGEQAVVIIKLPVATAELDISGFRPGDTGAERVFLTPKLAPGKDFVYKITVTWRQLGENHQDVRDAIVRAGGRTVVDFTVTPPKPPVKKIEPEIKKEVKKVDLEPKKVDPKPEEKKAARPLTEDERRQVLARLEKLGFEVFIGNVIITDQIKGKEKEIYGLLAQVDNLYAVNFQRGLNPTDEDVAHITQLIHLKHLKGVKELDLRISGLTDDNVKVLKELKHLEKVSLPDTVTAKSLDSLKELTHLRTLTVPPGFDAATIEALEKALPKTQIE